MLGERQSVTAEDLEKMVYLEQVVLACFVPLHYNFECPYKNVSQKEM